VTASFSFPTTILFGPGTRGNVRDRLTAMGMRRPLIVTDSGLVATKTFARAVEDLPRGLPVFSKVQSNPTADDVEAGRREYEANDCDGVIAIGGGSALDVGKMIRVRRWKPGEQLMDVINLPPFIAIPTTAGTGSEVGRSAVITIDQKKHVIFHPALLAKLVILDPELTVDLPPKLTAATGADALTHCVESFTSPTFHPLCDGIALEGIHLIADALPRAVKSPKDIDARGKMLVAATMGGIAFQKDLGAAHSLAHPLSSLCGLHHGLANALVLPAVMKFNQSRKPGVYDRVALAMGVKDAIAGVESLLREIGVAAGLRQHGVKDEHLQALTDQAFVDGCHQTNPVPVTRADLEKLYREAM
jgi:alcohol dehydrogenase class IV